MLAQTRLVISLAITALSVVNCDDSKYLKEQPEFLKPCHLHDKNNAACLAATVESLFTQWKDGIPGMPRFGTLEPFKTKRVRIAHNMDSVNLQLELRNMSTYGLSESKILNSTIDEKNYMYAFQVLLPKVKIQSAYKLRGQVLVLNINGHGNLTADMTDLEYAILLDTKLKQIDGEYFFDLNKVRTNVLRVGAFHIDMTNLFGGNRDLEESALELFNASWRELFEVLRPVLSQTYDAVLQSRFRKIFEYIPARFFFEDLP